MRALRKVFALAGTVYLITIVAIVAFALMVPQQDGPADVIVVLGAGMEPDGTLHGSSIQRVEKGVELFHAGVAPRLHFTGGAAVSGGPSSGAQMAALAHSLSVSEAVISHEDRSLSTLQNALFSQPILRDAGHILIVTDGFHLPRSWLSFTWAAWHVGAPTPEISVAFPARLRSPSPDWPFSPVAMPLREALAVWFNLTRLAMFEVGRVAGVDREIRDPWLN